MKPKSILTVVLLVFVLGSFAAIIAKEIRSPTQETPATSSTTSGENSAESAAPAADATVQTPAPEHQVIAYYFHGTARCVTCRTIEAYTREAILSGFPEDLGKQNLVWKVVNVDEPENQHFVTDYQLHTKSVVLVDTQKGQQTQWKNLDQVWNLVGSKESFLAYIQDETAKYLGAS